MVIFEIFVCLPEGMVDGREIQKKTHHRSDGFTKTSHQGLGQAGCQPQGHDRKNAGYIYHTYVGWDEGICTSIYRVYYTYYIHFTYISLYYIYINYV